MTRTKGYMTLYQIVTGILTVKHNRTFLVL